MSLQELSQVRASHDISTIPHDSGRARLTGQDRRAVPWSDRPTYTVEFSPRGVSGATVVLAGLNDRDVGISSDARDDACPGDGADWALAVSGQPGGFGLFTAGTQPLMLSRG